MTFRGQRQFGAEGSDGSAILCANLCSSSQSNLCTTSQSSLSEGLREGSAARRRTVKSPHISPATVARLPLYIQGLEALLHQGVRLTSSQRLAQVTGIEAAQIRRDLSYLGAFGTPGVGYDVRGLHHELCHYLGTSRVCAVALVGYGNLGSALVTFGGLEERNFHIAAIFDVAPDKVGRRVGDLVIEPTSRIPTVVKELAIEIAILATPSEAAQELSDLLVRAGVTAVLNFTPVTLAVPPRVTVRNIDVAAEMQILSFEERMKHALGTGFRTRPAVQRQVARPSLERY
ncbi:MAG: redox-sensing transcriptional repressor Rex [Chloroflexota bacterium]